MGKKLFGYILGLVLLASNAGFAQNTFNSGSTGADGAFAPTGTTATVNVPESGVLNYTTVDIPTGLKVVFIPNAQNTPVTILASGDVNIAGTISVDGQAGSSAGFGGAGGPGGSRGGNAGVDSSGGSLGDGPGAGRGGPLVSATTCGGGGGGSYQTAGASSNSTTTGCSTVTGEGGQAGPKYGNRTLIPLLGGSGGGGACGFSQQTGGGGGGGGGAILIASSGKIILANAAIAARGGGGAPVSCGNGASGGGGSCGAIRLVANTVTGTAQLLISGGASNSSGAGGIGFARVEAFDLSGFSPTSGTIISSGLPSSVTAANAPGLQITSVAGVAAPASPSGSFQGSPDVILPANQANPVAVVLNGTNIPNGATVTLTATAADGTSTTAQTTLTGTTASSTGTASINLSAGLSVLTATTVVDLGSVGELKPFLINGEKVDKIEVAARYGGGTDVTYITHSGRRIRALR